MSRYFKRLIARAAGPLPGARAFALVPTREPEVRSERLEDPFEAVATRAADVPRPADSTRAVPPPSPVTPPPQPATASRRTSSRSNPRSRPAAVSPPEPPIAHTLPHVSGPPARPREVSREPAPSRARAERQPKSDEPEAARPSKKRTRREREESPAPLEPAPSAEAVTMRARMVHAERAIDSLAEAPRLAPSPGPAPHERPVVQPPPSRSAPPASGNAPLAPRKPAGETTRDAAPDEPRLVIGRFTVEVTPPPVAPPREIVRVVASGASSMARRTAPSHASRLRFGLRQM